MIVVHVIYNEVKRFNEDLIKNIWSESPLDKNMTKLVSGGHRSTKRWDAKISLRMY